MSRIHFLNVGNGDCSVIQHNSNRVTVIDVNLAKPYLPLLTETAELPNTLLSTLLRTSSNTSGNYNQKENPENPVEYLAKHGISSVFRFILTHPDGDHMGGIEHFFNEFSPANFWDTAIEKGTFNTKDWEFYEELRKGKHAKRLELYSGNFGQYYNKNEIGDIGADGLRILSPTPDLISLANAIEETNDASYVILYLTGKFKILFAGDSHNETWKFILKKHIKLVEDCDILIAPHHGRDSDRDYSFLNIVRPKLTFFGNAPSPHLGYPAYRSRQLEVITNNGAGTIVVDIIGQNNMNIYVTNEKYAADYCMTHYGMQTKKTDDCQGFLIKSLTKR